LRATFIIANYNFTMKIAILGGGNLGQAMTAGLLKADFPADQIALTRRQTAKIAHFAAAGVNVGTDNANASAQADVIVLAVKPKVAPTVLTEILPQLQPEQAVISVVTGLEMDKLQAQLQGHPNVFRAMPNTASVVKESITCLSASPEATEAAKANVETFFKQIGEIAWVGEELLQAATVLGACGVAFAMRFMRAYMQAGIEIGFDAKTSQLVAAQILKGSAEILLENGTHPEAEIDKVTTPQGCTIVGLNEMEFRGFTSSLIKGIVTSYNKIAEIKDENK